MEFFRQDIQSKMLGVENDLLKNNEQMINNLKNELQSFLQTKDQPLLNYFSQKKENENIQKRLKTIEANLEISAQGSKVYLNKITQKKSKELDEYRKQFSLMKKTFLEKEFLLEEKFQGTLENLK